MKDKIELVGVKLEDEWQESEHPKDFGQDPNVRWFKEYAVYMKPIENKRKKGFLDVVLGARKKATRIDFPMHYGVCSPAMKQNPPANISHLIDTALVQNGFDESSAIENLRQKVASIQYDDEADLRRQLEKIVFILPEVEK